ncbi:MAG: uracil-DNA glycosylase [Nitrospinae bacterium]|nr:uracil-DNA glycosylase [Nitrospinota bacterium]
MLAKLGRLSAELERLKRSGVTAVPGALDPRWFERLKKAAQIDEAAAKKGAPPAPTPSPVTHASPPVNDTLELIAAEVAGCVACGLAATRTNTVPGEGEPQARLLFVGEAPGADEDAQGRPFVGRAGKLLADMIVAMGLTRERVFIANVLKCRPPGNRDPLPDEVAACEPFLRRQIARIRPDYICALGRISAQALLKTKTPIGQLRGEFHDYHGTPLLATYHPAYLLRNPGEKKEAWKDLQLLMARMGLPVPPQRS